MQQRGVPQPTAKTPLEGRKSDWLALALIFAIASLGALIIARAYWPGIMIDDARWQYQQALDNAYEDWHPPLMAWIWRRLILVEPGPAPMFVLQLALYWAGVLLMATWANRRGQPRLGIALVCLGWLPAPFALTGTVTKDCLMAGSLACSAGLLLWSKLATSRAARISLWGGAVIMIIAAAALRLNAFLACVPLALAGAPRPLIRTRSRLAVTAVCASLAFLSVGPAVAALVQAEKTGVELSLMIFDLGGITEHSGKSQFPDMHVANPVAVNHRCYDPHQWDGYSEWAKKPCPLGFDAFTSAIDENDLHPMRIWLGAILAHPLAYAEHRLTHFNLSTWFLVSKGPKDTAWSQSAPNPWGYQVRQNRVLATVNAAAELAGATPIGWPIFWISIGLAAFILGVSIRVSPQILAIPASASFYGLGFLIFGVATGMRYHMWTITGSALGAALVAGELLRTRVPVSARTGRLVGAMITLPALMAIAARLLA